MWKCDSSSNINSRNSSSKNVELNLLGKLTGISDVCLADSHILFSENSYSSCFSSSSSISTLCVDLIMLTPARIDRWFIMVLLVPTVEVSWFYFSPIWNNRSSRRSRITITEALHVSSCSGQQHDIHRSFTNLNFFRSMI